MPNWIEVLKTGTFTAKSGKPVSFTEADLDAIAAGYDAAKAPAPLVFGHPEDSDPAFGWAEEFKRKGDILRARFKDVPEVVKTLVNNGHYKKVSISLAADKKTVRHVGLLGAVPPAVPGLADVKFSEGESLTIEMSSKEETNMPTVEELKKKLEEEEKARKDAEDRANAAEDGKKAAETELSAIKDEASKTAVETKIEELISKGRILPANKDAVEAVALALGKTGDEIELSKGTGKKSLQDHFFDFLGTLPENGLLNEFSNPGDGKREEALPDDLMSKV
ncbi:phage protease [Desulforegula conservatrix]|uniref:phage protease n=1 Tax=Desulforegula conservatrix TaxID=153026 RepID=UPI0004204F96|nr:phage protease [Desulforegula conservatrix]